MRKFAFMVVVLCCVAATKSIAQEVKRYFFTHYTTTNGLLSNHIESMAQDDQGYLWIATMNGLQRFDGHTFISFRHEAWDPFSIPDNEVWETRIDKNKNLWLLFANGKAAIFNTRTFKCKEVRLDIADDLIKYSRKSFVIDSRGNIMILVPKLDLVTYNEKTNSFSSKYNVVQTKKNWIPFDMVEDAITGKFYMMADSGVMVYNSRTKTLNYSQDNKENDPVVKEYGNIQFPGYPYIDKKHRLWFQNWYMAGAPTMYCWDLTKQQKVMEGLHMGYVYQGYCEPKMLTEQADGRMFLTGTPMLAEFSETQKKFILVHNSLMGTLNTEYQVIIFSYSDREQNMWLCTRNDGLYKFNPSAQTFTSISHINPHTGLPGQMGIMTFIQTDNGDVLAGAWGEGIARYDSNMNRVPLRFNGIAEGNELTAWSMCRRRNGTIWIGMQQDGGNIMEYDQVTGRATQFPVFQRITIRQLAEDRQGKMWIGTHRQGLYKWTPGHAKFEDGLTKINIDASIINQLLIDSSGFLWVTAPPYGVYKINTATSEVVQVLNGSSKPALPSGNCGAMMQYNDSLMLIYCNNQLVIYNMKSRQVSLMGVADGLPSPYVMSILKDNAGYVWMGLQNGLCRLDLFKRSITYFDRDDGMANDNFTLAAAYKMRDGRLLFGANRDFVVFDPRNVNAHPQPPDAHLTEFRLSGRSLQLDSLDRLEAVELAHDNTSVIIDFSALSYLQANKFAYYFMLEGVDKNWVRSETQPRATYPYLGPGTYRFKVKTRSSDGVFSANTTELVIHVNAPFWRTWWFFSLLALAAAAVLFWLDRERMKRKEAIQQMRSNIAGNLHDDINTALNNINILSEMARRKADNEIHKSKEFIEQIHSKSRNMIVAMDDMLWSIDPQNDSMAKTTLRFKEYVGELNNRYGVNIEMTMEEKISALKLDMQLRHDAFILFKEVTEGVLKICPFDCKIHIGVQKQALMYTMETKNHSCDNQQLRHLPQRQDIAARLDSLRAHSRVIPNKETSVLELMIPLLSR